jgi:hypothetical protein
MQEYPIISVGLLGGIHGMVLNFWEVMMEFSESLPQEDKEKYLECVAAFKELDKRGGDDFATRVDANAPSQTSLSATLGRMVDLGCMEKIAKKHKSVYGY